MVNKRVNGQQLGCSISGMCVHVSQGVVTPICAGFKLGQPVYNLVELLTNESTVNNWAVMYLVHACTCVSRGGHSHTHHIKREKQTYVCSELC